MSFDLPSDIEEIISEYKRSSFRLSAEAITLNWRTKVDKEDRVQSIPLTLKKGVWYYIMSPFVRRYVNFHHGSNEIIIERCSLVRCYTLIFHHANFKIEELPSNISIPNFSPQSADDFVTGLTLCSTMKIPLLNIAFDISREIPQTLVLPGAQMYSDKEGNYLIIPVAEINLNEGSLQRVLESNVDEKLGKELNKVIKCNYSVSHEFGYEDLHISASEAKKHGLSTLSGGKGFNLNYRI